VARFLVFALPLLLVAMALFGFVTDQFGLEPRTAALGPLGLERAAPPPAALTLATWGIEALALAALFLLLQGRGGAWWIDGLLTGALAWVFRGPLLVATIALLSRLPRQPFVEFARLALVLDLACGLLLAGLARAMRLERG
jgi:hypothetical protein